MTRDLTRALIDAGPMSRAELVLHLRSTPDAVSYLLRKARPGIYIVRYDRQPEGVSGRCAPVYAVGNRPDATPLARLSNAETRKRYHARHTRLISIRRYPDYHRDQGVWAGLV